MYEAMSMSNVAKLVNSIATLEVGIFSSQLDADMLLEKVSCKPQT